MVPAELRIIRESYWIYVGQVMGQWQQDFEDIAFLFQWLLVSLKEFMVFASNAPVVLKIFQAMYIQECGKELGSLGCHCHGEVLFGSLQVF